MKGKKYYFIKYSSKIKGENHRGEWNDVTDMSISEWWLEVLEDFKEDEYHYSPTLDFTIEISKEDFDKLDGIVG